MNILIPMAGAGKRFADAGYIFPKPIIEIENISDYNLKEGLALNNEEINYLNELSNKLGRSSFKKSSNNDFRRSYFIVGFRIRKISSTSQKAWRNKIWNR